jgi:hypothetical protein
VIDREIEPRQAIAGEEVVDPEEELTARFRIQMRCYRVEGFMIKRKKKHGVQSQESIHRGPNMQNISTQAQCADKLGPYHN